MSNEQQEKSIEKKRGRGRPLGSTNASKKLTQSLAVASPEHTKAIQELAALNPIMPSEKISKRMSPESWNAMRVQLLLEILVEWPQLAEGILEDLKVNPKKYDPTHLEAFQAGNRELDRIIAEKQASESQGKEYRYGHPETR